MSTATVTVFNPFDPVIPKSKAIRHHSEAHTVTIEVEVSEETKIADKYSVRSQSATFPDVFESPDFFTTINRLNSFELEEDDEDRPSTFAYETTVSFLKRAAQFLGRGFPRASVSVGAGQGLRLTWRLQGGEIRLIVDGSKLGKSYIYVEPQNSDSYIENTVSGDKLAAAVLNMLS